jgi:hypothetical protein
MQMENVFYNGHGGYRKPSETIYHTDDRCPEVRKDRSLMQYEVDVTQLKQCSSCQRIEAGQERYYGQP